jgi:hypothetical protein
MSGTGVRDTVVLFLRERGNIRNYFHPEMQNRIIIITEKE